MSRANGAAIALALCCSVCGLSASAADADLEARFQQMRQAVQQLQDRVAELEAEVAATKLPSATLGTHAALAAEPMQAPVAPAATAERVEASTTFGGRIKFDAIWNSVSTGGARGTNRGDISLLPQQVPLTNRGERHQLSGSARESRLWMNAQVPTSAGDLGGYLEFDFLSNDGSGNRVEPRLRHAYATLPSAADGSSWTFGQTYSTILNVAAYPELNDSNGPVGVTNVRQPLVRWRRETAGGAWQLAFEEPDTLLMDETGARAAPNDARMPDVVLRFDPDAPGAAWSIALLLRQLRVDEVGNGANVPLRDSVWAAGVNVGGRVATVGRDNLRFSLTAGRGAGRYLSFGAFPDAQITANGNLHPLDSAGGFLAWQHWFSDVLRANWALGYGWSERGGGSLDSFSRRAASSHLNVLWSPWPASTFGLEWIHAWRQSQNGEQGKLDRLQFTSLVKF